MSRDLVEEFNVSRHINFNLDSRFYSKTRSGKAYRITEKGKNWLEKFKSLNDL
jgi:predicted transcriptional regulator